MIARALSLAVPLRPLRVRPRPAVPRGRGGVRVWRAGRVARGAPPGARPASFSFRPSPLPRPREPGAAVGPVPPQFAGLTGRGRYDECSALLNRTGAFVSLHLRHCTPLLCTEPLEGRWLFSALAPSGEHAADARRQVWRRLGRRRRAGRHLGLAGGRPRRDRVALPRRRPSSTRLSRPRTTARPRTRSAPRSGNAPSR